MEGFSVQVDLLALEPPYRIWTENRRAGSEYDVYSRQTTASWRYSEARGHIIAFCSRIRTYVWTEAPRN